MSYTIDVYRGVMEPRKGLLQFTAALAFFPQLVAGPILRARQILPQLEVMPVPTWQGAKHGFVLISAGLLKKTIADLLAGPVDAAFNSADPISVVEAWTGALAFAGQIYGDFSGYTDIAIGIGLLLGFKLPVNFRLPYFAGSPVDFWRRWHISLSSWLRDYLYISLGGNRQHRYRNVMVTMLLGGLWHGAAWTFVVWGAFHGALIVGVHYLSGLAPFMAYAASSSRVIRVFNSLVTFYLVVLGWVMFRALDLESALDMLGTMHLRGPATAAAPGATLFAILAVAGLATMHLLDALVIRFGDAIERRAWLLWPFVFVLQFFSFVIGKPDQAFIYFQF
jgi:alginate O-acetyltransferase complex protein AlgI